MFLRDGFFHSGNFQQWSNLPWTMVSIYASVISKYCGWYFPNSDTHFILTWIDHVLSVIVRMSGGYSSLGMGHFRSSWVIWILLIFMSLINCLRVYLSKISSSDCIILDPQSGCSSMTPVTVHQLNLHQLNFFA